MMICCLNAEEYPETLPDLTKHGSVNREQTYNLGATGLRGWIYTKAASNHDGQQGRTTTLSRQILVTHVGSKSPANGLIKVDDIILGIDRVLFSADARKSIALAIQEAEKTENYGFLKLMVCADVAPNHRKWQMNETEKYVSRCLPTNTIF